MAKSKAPLKEWKETINDMSYEELQRCIADPEICYPEFLEYAKSRLTEIENNMINVRKVFLRALKRKHIKYEFEDDENRINFTYSRKRFHADLDCEEDFVIIYYIHDILISKEDEAKTTRLAKAVNESNKICSVNTFYEERENPEFVFVVSKNSLDFISQDPNFDIELGVTLSGCLTAQKIVKGLMKRRYNKRTNIDAD